MGRGCRGVACRGVACGVWPAVVWLSSDWLRSGRCNHSVAPGIRCSGGGYGRAPGWGSAWAGAVRSCSVYSLRNQHPGYHCWCFLSAPSLFPARSAPGSVTVQWALWDPGEVREQGRGLPPAKKTQGTQEGLVPGRPPGCCSASGFGLAGGVHPPVIQRSALNASAVCPSVFMRVLTQSCPTLWPRRQQPVRLLCPWHFPRRVQERVAISYPR